MDGLVYARPEIDVLGVEFANAERGTRLVFNSRQPPVGLGDDFGHTGHGTAAVINECKILRLRFWKLWKLQVSNVGVGDRDIVDSDMARQIGL